MNGLHPAGELLCLSLCNNHQFSIYNVLYELDFVQKGLTHTAIFIYLFIYLFILYYFILFSYYIYFSCTKEIKNVII